MTLSTFRQFLARCSFKVSHLSLATLCTTLFLMPSTTSADVNWWRFEETNGFLNDSFGEATLHGSNVDQLVLPSQGRGHDFPRHFFGDIENRSAAAFDSSSDRLTAETFSVDSNFTIEIFAHIEDLDHPAVEGDAVLAGQWSAVPPGLARSDLSWAFHIEKEEVDEPELSLSLSNGIDLLEYPSGIVIREDTDYYLAASFDMEEANIITYHVKDLTSGTELQSVEIAHDVFALNPDPLFHIGNAADHSFGLLVGLVDEVRFSQGALDAENLLISRIGELGDFNGDGMLDATDVDRLTQALRIQDNNIRFDLNPDGKTDFDDLTVWVKDIRQSWFGDSNLDGEFNSTDFVAVFQMGRYETAIPAGWSEGDWNGDGVFSSTDFVTAFQDGGYEQGPREVMAVPETTNGILVAIIGILILIRRSFGELRS